MFTVRNSLICGPKKPTRMECDRNQLETIIEAFCRKFSSIVIQSRLGKKTRTACNERAETSVWFNLNIEEVPEVEDEVCRLLRNSDILRRTVQSFGRVPLLFCVEISLRSADGVSLVLEHWTATVSDSSCVPATPVSPTRDDQPSRNPPANPLSNTVTQLGLLLKSVLVVSRLTDVYGLSRHQTPDSHIILYRVFLGQPDVTTLGDAPSSSVVGDACAEPVSVTVNLHSRTSLTVNNISDAAPHQNMTEQQPLRPDAISKERRTNSDSVEMTAASSSSSSNTACKVTAGSSSDSSEQRRRRVAAFADDCHASACGETTDVPFSRLLDSFSAPVEVPQPTTTTAANDTFDRCYSSSHMSVNSHVEPPITSQSPPENGDDFVMVELKTPFSDTDSLDGELGHFFRRPASVLPSAHRCSPAPSTCSGGTGGSDGGDVGTTLAQQLRTFQQKSHEYDDLIAQLSRTGLDTGV